MKKAILAKKIGMTQIFDQETGEMIPVTVLEAGPCTVTQVKTVENDGYSAIQVGFGDIREKLVNKPLKGQFAKAGVAVKRVLREFRLEGAEECTVGSEIKAARSRLMYSRLVRRLTYPASPKVKDIRAPFIVSDSAEDPWSMVPSITVMQVLWAHPVTLPVFSKERNCLVIWEAYM